MTLDKEYFDYPHRSYGMDHDRYDWSMLTDRKAVQWPNNKKLALWVNVGLQYFPLNQQGKPFKVPGGMTMPYPDLRHYSLRDYGNRVGIYRFLKAFDHYGIKPTFAINTRLAERLPYLIDKIKERDDEIMCHGYHMDALHYGGQDSADEAQLIKKALDGLRELTGQKIRGWISPAKNESHNTPDLLAANGIEYFCDWVNDDMPYPFKTINGSLIAMPLSTELEDRFVIQNNQHSEDSWVEQVCDACDFLIAEAEQQGSRILALNIHPWLMGQPHRIAKLEQALEYITSKTEVWSANAGDILDCWQAQQ
ncbi:polysaccharide deacetylase family protein [Oceanicoccus sp. KOV_DT_Chl]|uniref:polysaccharide deacetylase family protein n=1 Tax=Oceanicoccus sp. KOV_DT_Chl TaxID=1904639 RepID=UPI000C7D1A98|nr:polysaccharide deacetylase family protein [Oceanicoccus sp. KOV_DT_Chl]